MKKALAIAVMAATVLVSYYLVDLQVPTEETTIPRIAVEKHTLENGLEVLLVEDHRLPRVAVDIWYHVGPVNEEAGRTGFAHLFEHMMFQKSKHIPEDSFFQFLELAGASDVNGTTGLDRTNYFETVPSNQLELALWLESDRMGYLLDDLTEASFENQKDVVRNERRESYENRPFGIVEEAIPHLMYPKGHPYYANVIGSHEDIQAARLDDVKNFFKQYYVPNNASIAIVGDIDKTNTLALVEKYFGSLKRGPDVPPVRVETPPITEERRLVVKDRVELPRIYMAWTVPPIYTDEDAVADIAANLLGGDKISRLYRRLVYQKRIAQDVVAYNYSNSLGSVFGIQATAAPSHTLEELEKEIDAELEILQTEPPTIAELNGTKRTVERGMLFSLEYNGGYGGIADRINAYNHYRGNPDFLEQDIRRYRKVTPQAIPEFASRYLTKDSRVVVYGEPGEQELGPEVPTPKLSQSDEGGESVNVDEPWRETPPQPGPEPKLTLPVPESFRLSNGLTVILDSRQALPVVVAQLNFRGGIAANPPEKPGLAGFALDMIDEGTMTHSSLEFAEQLKQTGVDISEVPARDYLGLELSATRGTVAQGFDLLADAVLHPAFAPAEVDRVRMRRLGELVQLKEDPGQVSDIMTILVLNGKANPYAYPVLGRESSVTGMTPEDLRAFWESQAIPANGSLVVSGDLSREELEPLLERSFAAWTGPEPTRPAVSATQPSRQVVLVDAPGAQQTEVRVAVPGPERSSPDYASFLVMNEILGGAFSSRINMNIRERHGYAYGAYTWIRALAFGGWLTAGSAVRTAVTAPAVGEILGEMKNMSILPIKPEEMMLAKSTLVRSLPSAFETTGSTVGMLSDIPVYDLDLGYYPQYARRVETISEEDVRNVAGKYLRPDRTIVIAVGDRKAIESGLRSLGIGNIQLRDAEGNPQ